MSVQDEVIASSSKKPSTFVPRKCSASNRLITAKDHASVQINIGEIDADGIYTKKNAIIAFCGAVRGNAQADTALTKFAQEKGFVKPLFRVQVDN